jgi:DNA-binding CsgD family transcriptional regulator
VSNEKLRPVERRLVAMRDAGYDVEDIASRLNRSPEHVTRMLAWIEIPRNGPAPRRAAAARESRVLALRAQGQSHEEIGARFKRSARYIRQLEGMAHYRRALELLG